MTFNLFFWKEQPGAQIRQETLIESLEDNEHFPGLEYLPLETITEAFRREFPDLQDDDHTLSWKADETHFDVAFLFRSERTVSLVTVYCAKCAATMARLHGVAESLD